MAVLSFESIRPPAPQLPELTRASRVLEARLDACRGAEDCLAVVRDWDDLRRQVGSHRALVNLRFQQDTRDPARRAAREEWDQLAPRWTELEVGIKRRLLEHPERAELERRIGAQAFALWRSQVLAFDPALVDDLVAEARLGAAYTELLASAELAFEGGTENLSTIVRFRQDPDRERRHGADRVLWGWCADHRAELDRLFDELVAVRTRMARALGLPSFVELGYQRMHRVDYDRGDVERFRATIRAELVPLAEALIARQSRELGLDPLMAWDEPLHDLRGNPAPLGGVDWQVGQARAMFEAMGPELGQFFARLDDGRFLDLDSRPGKAGGGFCTSFPTHGMPFVFANFNGTTSDVTVLTHEIGHAFQNYASRELWPSDYFWPTYESAEVHSMSLELLAWPHLEKLLGADGAERFRRVHLTDALLFLAYGTAVDHFQHEVYSRPQLSPEERHACWAALERTYLPWRRWGDLAHPARGGRWQLQRHIYLSPFYYIDYVLAQTCALQFWARAAEDRQGALDEYVALCRRGGSLPFQALVRSAGLTSPFDEGCLSAVLQRARTTLRI